MGDTVEDWNYLFDRLRARVRAEWDYLLFVYGRYWPTVLSALLFLTAVLVELLKGESAWVGSIALPVTVVGFVGSVILLGWDFVKVRDERAEYRVEALAAPPPLSPSQVRGLAIVSLGRQISDHGVEQFAITNEDLNARLRSEDVSVRIEPRRFALPVSLADIGSEMMRLGRVHERRLGRRRRATRFNGQLIRLCSDPASALKAHSAVGVQRVGYFDGECSNELWSYDVYHREVPIENPVRPHLLGRDGELLELENCGVGNIIGITLIVVTSDDQVVFIRQSDRNSIAPGGVSASSSGSLEWKDRRHGCRGLQELLLAGMKRELQEECRVSEDEIQNARITSFYRWWNRGAKPEFTALGRTSCSWEQIKARPVIGAEREYTRDRFAVPLRSLIAALDHDNGSRSPWLYGLPRAPLAEAWNQTFDDHRDAASISVNPSCEAAWRAAVDELRTEP